MTLVEILVGMGLLMFLTAAVIALQSLISRSEEFSVRTVLTTENANAAVQSLITELRSARMAETGAYPIVEANPQQVIFYANADADPQVERIRYTLSDQTLIKGTIDPQGFPVTYPVDQEIQKPVAQYIVSEGDPIFFYYNEDWPTDTTNNPLPTPADLSQVKLVRVVIRVNADPQEPQSELTLESSAQIRSLKENL